MGEFFDEINCLGEIESVEDATGLAGFSMEKCYLAVYFNNSQVGEITQKLRACSDEGLFVVEVIQLQFISGMGEILGAKHSGGKKRWKHHRAGAKSLKLLKKYTK